MVVFSLTKPAVIHYEALDSNARSLLRQGFLSNFVDIEARCLPRVIEGWAEVDDAEPGEQSNRARVGAGAAPRRRHPYGNIHRKTQASPEIHQGQGHRRNQTVYIRLLCARGFASPFRR